jgi:hypothetical protein
MDFGCARKAGCLLTAQVLSSLLARARRTVVLVMVGVFALFLAVQLILHFLIVRASVSSKARPVEGPQVAGALRRAASRQNLQALLPDAPDARREAQPEARRRSSALSSALRHAPAPGADAEEGVRSGRHVHFGADVEKVCY